ncbi:trichohyalin-like [Hyposmocoma kahamanoa]|uniref:trichohyalin-like n=1 Tax=Hyposmocoma kahamanoa TaxID=1477025 RepID=UPI000E6D60C3|nr:trichohyalin-like [Hyposmocoma kahamanoa]
MTKIKSKEPNVYFGHPIKFWKERQRREYDAPLDIDEIKKLDDIVRFDSTHLQKTEEEALIQEMVTKQEMEECGFCKEKDKKIENYEEAIERETERECQKALEREKIARGITSSRADEIYLREMQRMQMIEKKMVEQEHRNSEMMWHQVLMDNVRRKERKERKDFEKRQKDMLDRRRAYDEQIASANRKKQEAIKQEREKENRNIDQILKKMDQEHKEEIRRKKEQQLINKSNYKEGHEMKVSRLLREKIKDRKIDDGAIEVALKELRKERLRKEAEMRRLQLEKQIFTDYHSRERRLASELEEEAERITQEWKKDAEKKADEHTRQIEEAKRMNKEKAAEEYRQHLEQINKHLERERHERAVKMEKVKRGAFKELEMKLDDAYTELQRQMEYRNTLSDQIRENQKVLTHLLGNSIEVIEHGAKLFQRFCYDHNIVSKSKENELIDIENKQRPFTRKADMFKDCMETKVAKAPGRKR